MSEATKDSKQPKVKGKAKEKQPDSAPVEPITAQTVEETPAKSLQTLEGECFQSEYSFFWALYSNSFNLLSCYVDAHLTFFIIIFIFIFIFLYYYKSLYAKVKCGPPQVYAV